MSNNFGRYLLAIFLIILLISICFSIVFFTGKRKNNSCSFTEETIEPVKYGNIGVFFDRHSNMIIIPYGHTSENRGKAVSRPVFLKSPYKKRQIGEAVRTAMAVCSDSHPCGDQELIKTLGYGTWKEFTQGRRCVSINYMQKKGIVINPTLRNTDGVYCFVRSGGELVLGALADNEEIGAAVTVILSRCR